MEYRIEYKDDHEYATWTIEANSEENAILSLCNTLNKNRMQTEQVIPSDFAIV